MKYLFAAAENTSREVTIKIEADTPEQARWLAEQWFAIPDDVDRRNMAHAVPNIIHANIGAWARVESTDIQHHATEGP